ncbi:non-hydrolyzing UDP-N-acetylglucosamine 2-epimerase [Emcibacter sp.]|uniref:non-hydrolyzing UDP-N-acetylglucosamine 2-epimerase n=1 Tax=Emcibacter sp. TaxID=1979954 RepID=UPI003A8F3EE7
MQEHHRVLLCAGTRPELIKLAPVYRDLCTRPSFRPYLCLTGQHDSLVRDLPRALNIAPDFILERNPGDGSQLGLIKGLSAQLAKILQQLAPRLVVVQGDTASSLCAAMTAAHWNIPIAHVEAGLRTHDLLSPFPEELYRQLISRLAKWHFCPTRNNRTNLLKENIPRSQIHITGNTSIDALLEVSRQQKEPLETKSARRPYILITLHRREVQGERLAAIATAFAKFARAHDDFDFRIALHPSPAVRNLLHHILQPAGNIQLLPPMDYPDFVPLMKNAFAILSDSGGIQEEAPALDVPVIVIREKTERQEGVQSGCLRLAGHDPEKIFSELSMLIRDRDHYIDMCNAKAPFGDGRAGRQIGAILENLIKEQTTGYEQSHLPS